MSARELDHGLVWFYVCLGKSNGLECPFADLKSAIPEQIAGWMDQVDTRVTPTQLRRFLQDDESRANEPILRGLASRFREQHSPDKLFLTVAEYLYRFSPEWFQEQTTVSMGDVADVLQPVLGTTTTKAEDLPEWLPDLEELISELSAYEHLHQFTSYGIFDRGRKLKGRVSSKNLDTMGLVAFARFNYLLRKTFTTLWDAELWWIEQALTELESRAEFFVDCTEIGQSSIVPTNELYEMVCEWKRPMFTDYAQDLTYQRVQKVRQILESALKQPETV
jgi:hypothetical protein